MQVTLRETVGFDFNRQCIFCGSTEDTFALNSDWNHYIKIPRNIRFCRTYGTKHIRKNACTGYYLKLILQTTGASLTQLGNDLLTVSFWV